MSSPLASKAHISELICRKRRTCAEAERNTSRVGLVMAPHCTTSPWDHSLHTCARMPANSSFLAVYTHRPTCTGSSNSSCGEELHTEGFPYTDSVIHISTCMYVGVYIREYTSALYVGMPRGNNVHVVTY